MPATSLMVDPIDRRNAYVGPSTLGPSAGEGLFARQDLQVGSLVVNYGGTLKLRWMRKNGVCNEVSTQYSVLYIVLY